MFGLDIIMSLTQYHINLLHDPVYIFYFFMQILDSLDRSLEVYNKKDGCNQRRFCMFCSCESGDQELSTCSVCMEW